MAKYRYNSLLEFCRGGGTGRRAGFKIRFLRKCEFDSRPRYHSIKQSHSNELALQDRYYLQTCFKLNTVHAISLTVSVKNSPLNTPPQTLFDSI